jgi:pimeloyl-ACP methyl ester carboxylesterase
MNQRMAVPGSLAPCARSVTLPRSRAGIFYYEAGSPSLPPMLLVHGLGDEADTWRSVILPLSATFHVIAPDLPGFGRSTRPGRRRLAPRFLGRVLRELAATLGIRGAVGVGSSLGGVVVQLAAMEEPALFSRLVLLDGGVGIGGRIPPALLLMLLPGLGEKRYRSLSGNLGAAYASLRPYYADLDGLPSSEREFLKVRVGERVASDTQRRAYFSALRAFILWTVLRAPAARKTATALAPRTLTIWGAQDHIVAMPASPGGAPPLPLVIEGAGHLPHQEKPGEIVRIIEGFAGKAGQGGG